MHATMYQTVANAGYDLQSASPPERTSAPFLGFQSVVQRRPSNRALCCRLDYPGIGPEHSYLKDLGRAEYYAVTDAQALDAFVLISRLEGIIPALETSHAFAYLDK